MSHRRSLQTLRGLACVMLVAYHVVGDDSTRGLRLADGPIRLINDGLACLRMPLFAFLAGLAHALRPRDTSPLRVVEDKAMRLLLPMLSVGTLFALARAATPGTNVQSVDWSRLHLLPVGHFWFLESLFLVFVLVAVAEHVRLLDSARGLLMAWLLAALAYLMVNGPRELGIRGAVYLLPYFLGGLTLMRLGRLDALSRPGKRILLVALVLASLWMLGMPEANVDRRTLPMLLASTGLCLLLLGLRADLAWLARIGSDSYAVFLFHVFFTAATRIALHRAGVESTAVHLALGVLMGVGGPMVIARLLAGRGGWAACWLGQRPKPRAATPMAAGLAP